MSDMASSRMPPFVSLQVLVVCEDAEELRTFEQTAAHLGDSVTGVGDLAEAIAVATSLQPELAFVDVTLGERSALSLVHHLQTAAEGIAIYAMAPSAQLDMALEALTLGATGMVTLPTSGDAILRAIGEVREKLGTLRHREFLEAQLAHTRISIEAMRNLAKLAARGGMKDLMRAVADAVGEIARARAVSVYQPKGPTLDRVATSGPSTAPESTVERDLERFGAKEGRETFALGAGAIIVEGGEPAYRPAVAELTSFASSLVVLASHATSLDARAREVDHARFETVTRFRSMLTREVEEANRHGRKVSTACIVLSDPLGAVRRPLKIKEAFRGIVREGDVLGRDEGDDEVWLLLPNTSSLGAQLVRRKVGFGAVGTATFPQEAATADDLMALARKRAELSLRSPVRMLDLGRKGLRAIVDALLACPLLDAGAGSSYPLDLAVPAALSLVEHACIEARRGGTISVLVTGPRGIGFASAVRSACGPGEASNVVEVDLRASEDGVDAVVVAAEHGTWTCCGVLQRDRFKAVHAADAMLADLVARKLSEMVSA